MVITVMQPQHHPQIPQIKVTLHPGEPPGPGRGREGCGWRVPLPESDVHPSGGLQAFLGLPRHAPAWELPWLGGASTADGGLRTSKL